MSVYLRKAVKSFRINHSIQFLSKRTCTGSPKSPSKSPNPQSPPPQSPKPKTPPPIQTASSPNKDVPGLSSKILSVPSGEVGPGASKKAVYKNPEYFCYHSTSYFEAEVEMMKYRLPQPSNKASAQK